MSVCIYVCQVSYNPNTTEIPTPTWKELTGIDGNGKMGKILVQLIKK